MEEVELEKKLTANQLFKQYKDEGGILNFSDWLSREKKKGVFPLNANLNDDINKKLLEIKTSDMNSTILGFPTKTLVIAASIIVVAIIVHQIIKKK